jgi:16S rRNA (adenine1518-N6/adenine1519-N6)-dimethyltransferase
MLALLQVTCISRRRKKDAFEPPLLPPLSVRGAETMVLSPRVRTSLLLIVARSQLCTAARAPTRGAGAGSKYPFIAKQSLGQNFLVDDGLARRIVESVDGDTGDGGSAVVELGPGQGALTRHALERWPRMTAVELDRRAIAALEQTLPALRMEQGDMLRVDWATMARAADGAERLCVLTNPPYHLTAELLLLLVSNAEHIGSVVLTLQKEAVERLLAPPRCKQYSALGVLYALFADTEVLFELPPTAFSPPPKVTSTCIRVTFRPHARLDLASVRSVHTVARAAFCERRKMLRQSMRALVGGLEPGSGGEGGADEAVVVPARYAALRAEQLEPDDFVELSAALGLVRTR